MAMPVYAFSDLSSGSHNVANGGTLNAQAHDNPVGITKKYIYIIRNYINEKVYIGQAINPEQRFKGHISDKDRKKSISAIDGAINKYGAENFYYEILEGPIENYNEREKYWISFFNCITPLGYNILEGGQEPPVRRGYENCKSKFTPKDVTEIKELLLNPHLTLSEIAKKYEVSYRTISNINLGKTYFDEDVEYPIRKFQCSKESPNMIKPEIVDKIIKDLLNTKISLNQLAKKYKVNSNQIASINNGSAERYRREGFVYPLRMIELRPTEEQVKTIKELLITGVLSKQQIARKVGVLYTVVSNINSGRTYHDKDLIYPLKKHEGRYDWGEEVFETVRKMLYEGISPKKIAANLNLPNVAMVYDINIGKTHVSDKYKYPIQKPQNHFSDEQIKKITWEIVNTDKSLTQIAKENNMHKSNVIALKNGQWKKYRLPEYSYPLRPNN